MACSLAWGNPGPTVIRNFEIIPQDHLPKELAQKWFHFYTKGGRKSLLRHLKNGEQIRKTVEVILLSHDVPLDLYYVGLVESGYYNRAVSHMGAKGPWQFMPATAKRYGLKQESWIDERQSIYKATHAAAKYLKDLYNFFDSWTLAIAAYNAGEYRIIDAIRRAGTRDFKKLSLGGFLPDETKNYLAKIWVLSQLDRKKKKLGLELPSIEYEQDLLDSVKVGHFMTFSELESLTGIPTLKIRKWNPDLLKNTIRPSQNSYFELFLPRINAQSLRKSLKTFRLTQIKDPRILNKLGLRRARKGDLIRLSNLSTGKVYVKDLSTGDFIIIDKNKIKI